jgi:hypothetical protein
MIAFLKLLLAAAGYIAKYLSDQKLLAAGEAIAIAGQLREILQNVEQAEKAANAVDRDHPSYDDDYARRVRDANERQ